MIKIYQKNLKQEQLQQLEEFKVGSWLYIIDPGEEELKQLIRPYKLDDGLLHDAIDPLEVPRVENERQVTYIYIRFPLHIEQRIVTTPLLIAISKEYFLTLSKEELPMIEKFWNGEVAFYTTQKTKLLLQLLLQINFAYHQSLTEISKKVRGFTGKLENIGNKELIQLVTFEEALNDFIGALNPINNILQELINKRWLTLYESDIDLIEDLQLSNDQLISACKATLKSIVNIREAYSTIMTNNLNQVIKLLTALTILLTIPNVITGFFGMNVHLPLASHPFTFITVIITTLIIWTVLIFIFFKNRWL